MFKFKKLSNSTMMIFDIIGSFFVDCWYNTLYIKAYDIVKSGHGRTITDTYRYNITQYIRGINSDKRCVLQVVKQLHSYYQLTIGVNFIQFSEFEDKLLAEFVPAEYYGDFDTTNKDKILHEIISRTVVEFGQSILDKRILERLIDDHENKANVTELQDIIIGILSGQRDDYYMRFVRERFKPQERNGFDRDVFNKLKAAFIEEKRQKIALEEENTRLKAGVKRIAEQLVAMRKSQSEEKHSEKEYLTLPIQSAAQLKKSQREVTFFDAEDDIANFLEASLPVARKPILRDSSRQPQYSINERHIEPPKKIAPRVEKPEKPIPPENTKLAEPPQRKPEEIAAALPELPQRPSDAAPERTVNKEFYLRRQREIDQFYLDEMGADTEPLVNEPEDAIEYDAETPW